MRPGLPKHAQGRPQQLEKLTMPQNQISQPWGEAKTGLISGLVCRGCHHQMPQTGELSQQKFISRSSGGWETNMQVQQGLRAGESSHPDLLTVAFHCSPHVVYPFSTAKRKRKRERRREREGKAINFIGLDPLPLTVLFNLNYFPKSHLQIQSN